MKVLQGLEPVRVMDHFEQLCAIPHGSGSTKAISDHCADFARTLGLRVAQDAHNNLMIWKDGTPGYEHSPAVMVQGHLDMVCEKELDCDLDFSRDGLRLRVDDGVISAEGTTLGGDDGIAVAYALALLEAEDIPHPPLEVVLTVDEEIGLLGAAALDTSPLQSRMMLNLDSEEEGYLLVSCAGGCTATCRLPLEREPVVPTSAASETRCTLEVYGGLGGHSGTEIDKGRGNANLLLGRALYRLREEFEYYLVSVSGGFKDNAIPRSAAAELLLPDGIALSHVEQAVAELDKTFRAEYGLTDPELSLRCKPMGGEEDPLTEESACHLITALMNLPAGVQRMSASMPGMVQTSLNLGILRTGDTEAELSYSVRSSVESEKRALVDQLRCLTELLGGTVTVQGDYPGWAYREDSPLREHMVRVFERLYGRTPVVYSMHAGVECGLFAAKMPGLDCVSFGPDLLDIHTPQERMSAESVRRIWEYLLEILKGLK